MALETGRQRRSAELARKSRIRPSPGHGRRQCPGQTPRNRGASAACIHGPRFAGKWVVVQAVSSEPVSADFPVIQGKNREFSENQAVMDRIRCSNQLISHVFLIEFPKHRNREIFQPNRKFKSRNRELSGGSGNRNTGPPQVQIGGTLPALFTPGSRGFLSSASVVAGARRSGNRAERFAE